MSGASTAIATRSNSSTMLPRYVEVFDDFPRNETSMRVRKNELRARGVTETA